jgi:threonyl-tRNA synthetase
MFGSLERFIGILIEHHGGHLPLCAPPLQAVVARRGGCAAGRAA